MDYRWQAGSTAESLTLTRGGSGKAPHVSGVLALAGDTAASPEQRAALAGQGYGVLEDIQDGRRVLRVSGKGDEQALLNALSASGLTAGEATGGSAPGPAGKDKQNAVQRAASSYMVGNVATLASGALRWKAGGKNEFWSAIVFTSVDVAMRIFGKKGDAEQQRDLLAGLHRHLNAQGIPVADDNPMALAVADRPAGMFERLSRWMQDNIVLLKILSEVVGGALQAKGGLDQANTMKAASGVVLAGGSLVSLLVKEGNEAQLHQELLEKNGAAALEPSGKLKSYKQLLAESPMATRAMHYLRRNPLMLPFTFARINNVLLLAGAVDEWRHPDRLEKNTRARIEGGQVDRFATPSHYEPGINSQVREAETALSGLSGKPRDLAQARLDGLVKHRGALQAELDFAAKPWAKKLWTLNVVQAFSFGAGNTFMSKASKNAGVESNEAADIALLAAANAIGQLPPGQRDGQIATTANYLAGQHTVGLRADEVETRLHAKIAELEGRHAATVAVEKMQDSAPEMTHQQRIGERPQRMPPTMQKPSGWSAKREAEREAAETGQGVALA